MPISAFELFDLAGMKVCGTVPWGSLPNTHKSAGIYAVSLSANPHTNGGLLATAPIMESKIDDWIRRVPSFKFKGQIKPNVKLVADYLQNFWLKDESIIYVGKAASLRNRLGDFKLHVLGDKRPHKGGHWIKTFAEVEMLSIHFCTTSSVAKAEAKENEMLAVFKSQVAREYLVRLANPIPFANLEHPKCNRKQDGIRYSVRG
jgi:hypothetical protein